MGFFESFQLVIIGLYLAGTLLFLAGAALNREAPKRLAAGLALAGLGLHVADLVIQATGRAGVLQGGDFYLNLISCSILLAALLAWWRFQSRFLALAMLPLALLLFMGSLAAGGIRVLVPKQLTAVFFGLHITALVVCLALLTLACGAGLAFLHLNKRIKNKAGLSGLGQDLPSLANFDRINRWAALAGFPLYTLGLISGFAWRWMDPVRRFSWDALNITALAVWFLFTVLFYQRAILGWRGRKPAMMAIAVFACIVIAFLHHTITFRS